MKTFIIFLAVFICSGAVFGQSASETEKIRTSIVAVMDDQAVAWNRGDTEGFMRGYWNSPELVFVSGDNVTRGWRPTLDRYKKNYDSREKMGSLKFTDLVINVISKDAAVVLGSWSLTRATDNPKGKFTLIFRKFGDGWRIVHDHTS